MANLTPLFLNNVSSTVQAGSSAIGSATATGVNVATGDGANFGTIGTNQYIPAVIVDTSTSPETVKEYVWITARTTDALTVVRQAEDSSRYAASTTSIQSGYTIAAVATSTLASPLRTQPSRHNLLGWTGDLLTASAATNAQSSGTLLLASIDWPVTASISNVWFHIATAGGTLTSGRNLVGIYSSAGALLASSADQSSVWTLNGVKQTALTGAPISIARSDWIWVGILAVGTTTPIFRQHTNVTASLTGLNLTAAQSRFGVYGSGLTALPSPLTPSSIDNTQPIAPWCGVS